MNFTQLIYAQATGVATITLHRPDALNALTPTLERELREAVALAEATSDVRVIVIAGSGKAFCAGADLKAAQIPSVDNPATERLTYLWQAHKPLLAALDGAAIGIGACIALHCDLRYLSPRAKIGLPYVRRGMVAEHGVAWLLPRLIGAAHAHELLLTGRIVSAAQAQRLGLGVLLEDADFAVAVHQRALEVASQNSPRSLRIVKQQLRRALHSTYAEDVAHADQELAACRTTSDFREGIAHFLEKRAPRFTGH